MRLNCEILIVNRLAPSANIRNTTKPARASLAIGRKESTKSSDGTAAKTVFLLVCTAKERTGTKYKVCAKNASLINVEIIFSFTLKDNRHS